MGIVAVELPYAKIKTIYYVEGYPDALAEEMLAEAGIEVIKLDSKSASSEE